VNRREQAIIVALLLISAIVTPDEPTRQLPAPPDPKKN
jgi:hypothetical protein